MVMRNGCLTRLARLAENKHIATHTKGSTVSMTTKKVTGIKSKKNSSSETSHCVWRYQMLGHTLGKKKGWVRIDRLDVKEAIFCILKRGSSYRKPRNTSPTGRTTTWCVWKSLVRQDQLVEGEIRLLSFRQPFWTLNQDSSV